MDIVHPDIDQQAVWQRENLEDLRYKYNGIERGELCLDIGSYQREWGKRMELNYGVVVDYFDALDNRAAWIFNGHQWFAGAFYYTSMYEVENPVQYRCVDIAEYIKQEIAVCKINIEGGEYLLLDHIIETGCIEKIRNLQVQFHVIEGQDYKQYYELLAKRLSFTHELSWRYPYCWENWVRK